ncbi:MAG TPA: tripartite tricarboxylate transporter TctB family protein [Paenalcaligenes sp.]|nr:tripartite tricarboxylate transporter TctB family protein [Paenalcaligenes sp.]
MKFKFNRKEFWASFLMLFIGIATIIGSQNYQMGSLIRMGPGYFPLMLGILLTAIAVLILFSPEALTDDGDTDDGVVLTMREQVTTWALVVGSVILFIIIGKYGGLIPATFVMCSLAALGDKGNTWKTAVIIGVVMSIVSAALFVYGLQIQFPMFTWG